MITQCHSVNHSFSVSFWCRFHTFAILHSQTCVLICINNFVFEYEVIGMFPGEMSYQHPYLPFNAQGVTLRCYVQKKYGAIFLVLTRLACSEKILGAYPVIFFRLCIPVDSVLWPDHTFPQLWDWNPVDGDSVHLIYIFFQMHGAHYYWRSFVLFSSWHYYALYILVG